MFKAFFFRVWSPFLKRGKKEFKPLDGQKLERVLFLRPEKIGDMVISFPVFDGLSLHYPHIRISILASPKNKAIIEGDPRFAHIFLYTKNILADIKTILSMRREKFDCVVDMIANDSVTSLFLSQMCAPGKPRIGVSKDKFRAYYDFNYDSRLGDTGHIVENTLRLLTAFGIDSSQIDGYSQPHISMEALEKSEQFIDEIRSAASWFLLGYNLSAGAPNRVWAEEKSVALIRRILENRSDCTIVLFCTPSERSKGERIIKNFEERVKLLPPNLSLMEASALISKLDLMITPDTSIVHIARAFNVGVIGLYSRYQKNFLRWRPYDQEDGAVVSGNDGNIFDITVDHVYETFLRVSTRLAERSAS